MSGWQTRQIGHFPEYEMVPADSIVNKDCYIKACEIDNITNDSGVTLVIHFLVHIIDENKDYEIRTGAQAIVKTINAMTPDEINKLIASKEKTRFVKEKTVNGFSMLKML